MPNNQEITQEEREKLASELRVFVDTVIDKSMSRVIAEIQDIYTTCVQQFYATFPNDEKVPKIYKRHGEIKGKNLYNAIPEVYAKRNGVTSRINIPTTVQEFDIDSLKPYRNPFTGKPPKKVDDEYIFNCFLDGIRGFRQLGNGGYGNRNGWGRTFECEYDSDIFYGTGSPIQILQSFYDNLEAIYSEIEKDTMKSELSSGKYPLIKKYK